MCKFSNMNRKRLIHECRVNCFAKVTRDCMDAEPYVVHVLSRDVLMVFGGRLTEPTYVKKIVADGDLNPKTKKNGRGIKGHELWYLFSTGYGSGFGAVQ